MKNAFIKQTASDYDIEYTTVKEIIECYPSSFHEKLEGIIKKRAVNLKPQPPNPPTSQIQVDNGIAPDD